MGVKKDEENNLGDGNTSSLVSSKFLCKIRRALHLAKASLKFLAFLEDEPVHHVWSNPSVGALTVWCCASMVGGITISVWFFLTSPIPFVTVFGNMLIGEFVGFFAVLEVCHLAWDRCE
jgi:hypothetical protein